MEKVVFKVENAVCKQIRVVTGEKVREYTVVHETVFKASKGLPINHLVHSIHLAKVKLPDGSDDIIAFYKNCYGHNIAILNQDIVNLLKAGENICFLSNGVIIFWSEHSLCTTIDMQQLDFHLELDSFLEVNNIIFLTERYVTLRNFSNENEVKKLKVDVNLAGENPVKITFLSKKQIFD
mgnify:CR=1 FL=1